MNNEGLILELFRRVQELEEKVVKLESKKLSGNGGNEFALSGERITRVDARRFVMNKFIDENPEHIAMIGKQKEGSGIVIINEESGISYRVKMYHSNSHSKDKLFGWHKVYSDQFIEKKYDFYVFTVYWNGKIYSFIFSHEEFCGLISSKKEEKKIYHLYFEMENGIFYETRDQKPSSGYDVTEYYNNWQIK